MANNSTSTLVHGPCLSETSSRSITESVTAAHNFEVTNYSLLDGMGVGKVVSSSVFSVGGHDWTISFYPDGCNTDCADNASSFLDHLSTGKDVRTKFTFTLLGKQKELVARSLEHMFSPATKDWGFMKFVEKSKLRTTSRLNNGCFTIRCVLTVFKETRTEDMRNLVDVPKPNLHVHLEHMLKNGEGADVTFSVGGQLFNVHRCVLAARSLVFKAELFGPMKEKVAKRIRIDGIEPAIFEALVHFMYTDAITTDFKQGNTANLQHLLVAADRYGVDRLKAMCEDMLYQSIDVETVATTLVLADQHHCTQLRKICIEFMASRDVLGAIMQTDGFRHMTASYPTLIEDVLNKVFNLV